MTEKSAHWLDGLCLEQVWTPQEEELYFAKIFPAMAKFYEREKPELRTPMGRMEFMIKELDDELTGKRRKKYSFGHILRIISEEESDKALLMLEEIYRDSFPIYEV